MNKKLQTVLSCRAYRYALNNFQKVRFKYEWKLPTGWDTGIQIYNRINKKNVPLIVSNKNFVKWYICGPTVYDASHIGHASCYIRFDIIRRILEEYFNIKPVVVLGITDIDDKIIEKSNKLKTDFKLLAKQYELDFFKDLNDLNILPPALAVRVSDHIPEVINFISKIIDKGHAYVVDDGSVYFNSKASQNYGKLCQLPPEGASSLKKGQKCYLDFALWKGSKPNEPFWESPWGEGRPGWHIECSAMSSKIFGSNLDLHSGGIDLVFPHHENEEAQSCSFHECDQWVNYWFHAGSLLIQEEKMSKSLGNFISISDFLKKYTPDHIRMFCFVSQYRKGLHYCSDSMKMAVDACEKISEFLTNSNSYIQGNWFKGNVSESTLLEVLDETSKNVRENLMTDFNTGACFISIMKLIKTTTKMLNEENIPTSGRSPGTVAAVSNYVADIFKSFGFQFNLVNSSNEAGDQRKLEYLLGTAIKFRSAIRSEALSCTDKSFKQNLLQACDSFRNELGNIGVSIKDQGKNSSSWGIQKTAMQ